MKNHMLQISFKDYAGFKVIRHCILDYIQEILKCTNSPLEVALNEAVNNALSHGRGPVFTIKIDIIGKRRLILRVKDSGPGFLSAEYLTKADELNEVEESLFSESGRGILLMRLFSDYIKYNAKGNEVLLMKRLPAGE